MTDQERYLAAAHAIQSGVAMKMNYDGGPTSGETSPKHLRVGVNMAMSDGSSLAKLLMDKGVITEAEYFAAIADGAEREKALYESALNAHFAGGPTVTLG